MLVLPPQAVTIGFVVCAELLLPVYQAVACAGTVVRRLLLPVGKLTLPSIRLTIQQAVTNELGAATRCRLRLLLSFGKLTLPSRKQKSLQANTNEAGAGTPCRSGCRDTLPKRVQAQPACPPALTKDDSCAKIALNKSRNNDDLMKGAYDYGVQRTEKAWN